MSDEETTNLPAKRKPRKSKTDVAKRSRGRPEHEPTKVTRNQVLHFCGMGMTHKQISLLLGIAPVTLAKHYRQELDVGEAKMNVDVANNLYTIATSKEHKSAAQAAIFWMKARGRWRETNRVEHTGADGGAIQNQIVKPEVIDSSKLSAEHRDALREIIAAAIADKKRLEARQPAADLEGEFEEMPEDDDEDDEG